MIDMATETGRLGTAMAEAKAQKRALAKIARMRAKLAKLQAENAAAEAALLAAYPDIAQVAAPTPPAAPIPPAPSAFPPFVPPPNDRDRYFEELGAACVDRYKDATPPSDPNDPKAAIIRYYAQCATYVRPPRVMPDLNTWVEERLETRYGHDLLEAKIAYCDRHRVAFRDVGWDDPGDDFNMGDVR